MYKKPRKNEITGDRHYTIVFCRKNCICNAFAMLKNTQIFVLFKTKEIYVFF